MVAYVRPDAQPKVAHCRYLDRCAPTQWSETAASTAGGRETDPGNRDTAAGLAGDNLDGRQGRIGRVGDSAAVGERSLERAERGGRDHLSGCEDGDARRGGRDQFGAHAAHGGCRGNGLVASEERAAGVGRGGWLDG